MTTLTAQPLAKLLDRLFADAQASTARMIARYSTMPDSEREKISSGAGDYRQFYADCKDDALAVSRDTGTLLYMLARSTRARHIVEFGTSFGISTLHLAAALRDNGGGRVITTEFEPAKVVRARKNLTDGGLIDLVDIREGDALVTLTRDLPDNIDLVLLDGAKHLYSPVLDLLEAKLRPGALLVADNADWNPTFLQRMRSPSDGYVSVPFGVDVEVSMRLG